MVYTIVRMEDVQSDHSVELIKMGNEYGVEFGAGDTFTLKTYSTLKEAKTVFDSISNDFIMGEGSEHDRRNKIK